MYLSYNFMYFFPHALFRFYDQLTRKRLKFWYEYFWNRILWRSNYILWDELNTMPRTMMIVTFRNQKTNVGTLLPMASYVL